MPLFSGLQRGLKKWLLRDEPETGSYQPIGMQIGASFLQKRPIFTLYWADLMTLDEQVWFGTCVGNGPLMSGKVEVTGASPEITTFVQKQWDKLWSTSASLVLRTKLYGYMGYEIRYKDVDGRVEFDALLDRHPRDCRPLTIGSKLAGINVHNVKGKGKVTLGYGRGCWLRYDPQFGSYFGQSLYSHAFNPWYEKAMDGGAIDLRRLRMFKDAWTGDVLYYDIAAKMKHPDGREVSMRDVAREMTELRASGGVLQLPMRMSEAGMQKIMEYSPPTAVAGATQILEWSRELDWGIFDGVLVPREVVEASATGSGFSGRSIPLIAFCSARDGEFGQHVRDLKVQVMDPMVIANFGERAATEYELEPVPLLETMGELMGPMGQPDTSEGEPPPEDGDNDGLVREGQRGGPQRIPPAKAKAGAGAGQNGQGNSRAALQFATVDDERKPAKPTADRLTDRALAASSAITLDVRRRLDTLLKKN